MGPIEWMQLISTWSVAEVRREKTWLWPLGLEKRTSVV
jgi:hypothetical protein